MLCLFDSLLYVPGNSYGHVVTLTGERDVKQYIKQIRISSRNKTQIFIERFMLMCDKAFRVRLEMRQPV